MHTSHKIRVGTITANFNCGKYISQCLDGILGQSSQPEIITIVDDKSTDDSITIVKDFFQSKSFDINENDDIVRGVKHNATQEFVLFKAKENRGPASARNIGLKYLMDKVDVIGIADADDVYYKDKIKRSVEIFRSHGHIGLVYSDYDTQKEFNDGKIEVYREYKEPFSFRRLTEECIVSNNSFIASSILPRVGLYDESLYGPEDYDMWLRICDVAAAYHIPEALYKYRVYGGNLTLRTPKPQFAAHVQRVYQKLAERQANGQRNIS